MLSFSLIKLTRLFNKERIDEITLEEIEKIFQVPPTYFPLATIQPPPIAGADGKDPENSNCWQLLYQAQQHIIQLQQQIIAMSQPSVNAPVGRVRQEQRQA